MNQGAFCTCGAWRGHLGLEPTPELYVEHLVSVFREVRRVLREDGVLWLNLGDCYHSGDRGGYRLDSHRWEKSELQSKRADRGGSGIPLAPNRLPQVGLKDKDLVGVPWMAAFALRADGWWLRGEVVWAKGLSFRPDYSGSVMPESVRDRPTRSHEQLFLLTKATTYFYDEVAVRERAVSAEEIRWDDGLDGHGGGISHAGQGTSTRKFRPGRSGNVARKLDVPTRPNDHLGQSVPWEGVTRNLRSVWAISPQPYSEAHFACVDEGTECLTAQGWRRHDEMSSGDLAAQYDVATGRLSWGTVEAIARYPVADEPMVVAVSRDLRLALTPNHRSVIVRRHPRTRQWQAPVMIRADALKPSHAIPVSGAWVVDGDEPLSPEWAELLGWYVAEGHEPAASWAVELYQSPTAHPEQTARIRKLLDALGADYEETTAIRRWCGIVRGRSGNGRGSSALTCFRAGGFVALRLRELAPRKRLDAGTILRWSERLLVALLDGLLGGDGHTRRDDGRQCFVQKPKATADLAQAIGVRLGYATKLTRRTDASWVLYLTRKRFISLRGTGGEGAQIMTERYSGIVWCPQTPLGTWVARRNGRAFITGNTMPPALAKPCILAGTSERGCCRFCGAPWERICNRDRIEDRPNRVQGRDGDSLADAHGRDGRSGNRFSLLGGGTVGWSPTCRCRNQRGRTVPPVVLDPFAGSGTTLFVARELGRHAVGIDLNPEYVKLAADRVRQEVLW